MIILNEFWRFIVGTDDNANRKNTPRSGNRNPGTAPGILLYQDANRVLSSRNYIGSYLLVLFFVNVFSGKLICSERAGLIYEYVYGYNFGGKLDGDGPNERENIALVVKQLIIQFNRNIPGCLCSDRILRIGTAAQ